MFSNISNISNKTIRKFLTFGRSSGKTTSIINQARQEQKNGKKCAIISLYPELIVGDDSIQFVHSDINVKRKITSDKIDVIHLGRIIDLLQDEVDCLDYSETWWKKFPQFEEYDYLYIDAECYEKLVHELICRLDNITREMSKLRQIVTEKLTKIEMTGK